MMESSLSEPNEGWGETIDLSQPLTGNPPKLDSALRALEHFFSHVLFLRDL